MSIHMKSVEGEENTAAESAFIYGKRKIYSLLNAENK